MDKTVILLALVGILSINAQPPPPGYYNRGPPPFPGKVKPAGPSKMFSWLGSGFKMPKLPHFMSKFQKSPPPPPNFSRPPYGVKYSGGGPEKFHSGGPPPYNAIPSTIYYTSGQDYQIPGNTVNTVIYETHHQQIASPGPMPTSYHQPMQIVSQSQPGVVYEPGKPDISYQHVPAQKVYSPAPSQFFKQSSGNMEILPSRMVSYQKETISTGVPEHQQLEGSVTQSSYLSPLGSSSVPSPNFSQAPYIPVSQGPDYHNTGYRNQQNQIQGQQRVDQLNFGSMFQDSQPQVSPIYDLSSLNLDNIGGGTGPIYQTSASNPQQQVYNVNSPDTVSLDSILSSFGHQQGQAQLQGQATSDVQQGAYSQQSIVSVPAPNHFQVQDQMQSGDDSQGAYSHQSVVSVPAPSYTSQGDNFQSAGADLGVAESQYPGVQIRANPGGQEGVFEVIADANAPLHEGGHPFDIKKLMSMIEPGAQFATSDIVPEAEEGAASEAQESFVPAPNQEDGQSQGQYQVQDNSGVSYTVLQQGTISNLNHFNNSNDEKPNPVKTIKGYVTFPDDSTNDKKNLTKSFKPFKVSKPSTTFPRLNSDFPNTLQIPGGSRPTLTSKDTIPPPKPHDLIQPTHDNKKSTETQKSSDNELLTLGRPQTTQNIPVVVNKSNPKPSLQILPQKTLKPTPRPNDNKMYSVTGNPLSHTQIFSEESPSIIYTVKPYIASYINGNQSSNDNGEHPNHNYMMKVTPSTTSLAYPHPGLVPTVNSFFDSVSSEVNSAGGKAKNDFDSFDPSDLFVETEGDLAASDSRQVQAYAITVTPPTTLFKKVETATSSSSTSSLNITSTVTPDMLKSRQNGTSSVSISVSSTVDKKAKRFPVYQRKSKPEPMNSTK